MEDVAKAFAKAVDTILPSGVYNVGSGYATSVYEICRSVEKHLLGTETISKQVLDNGQQDETVNFWADMEKSKMYDFIMNTTIDEGINNLLETI